MARELESKIMKEIGLGNGYLGPTSRNEKNLVETAINAFPGAVEKYRHEGEVISLTDEQSITMLKILARRKNGESPLKKVYIAMAYLISAQIRIAEDPDMSNAKAYLNFASYYAQQVYPGPSKR